MEKKTEKRTFSAIAAEVMNLWKAKYGNDLPWSLKCALPYLEAMLECDTTDKDAQYYAETVESVVVYFLAERLIGHKKCLVIKLHSALPLTEEDRDVLAKLLME